MLARSKTARSTGRASWIGLAAFLAVASPVHAAPLDKQLNALLDLECAGLNIDPTTYITTGSARVPIELSGALQLICTQPFVPPLPPGGTPTSGGGAAGQLATQLSLSGLGIATRRAEEKKDQRREMEASDAGPLGIAGSGDPGQIEWTGVFGAWDAFGTLEFDGRDRDNTKFEAGFDSLDWNVLVGADRRFGADHFAGLALQYARVDGDFDTGGDFSRDTAGLVAYGGYRLTEGLTATLDASYAHTWDDIERRARGVFSYSTINGLVKSDSDSDRFSSRLALEQSLRFGRYTLSGRAGAFVDYVHVDDVREKGSTGVELDIEDREQLSVQSQIAAGVSAAYSLPFGVIVPQLEVEYVHEFENDQESIRATFVDDLRPTPTRFAFETDSPDRDFVNLRASVVLSLSQRIRPYAQFRTILGNEYLQSYGGAIGVRISLRN